MNIIDSVGTKMSTGEVDTERLATTTETEKFFESTRGQIVLLLLDEPRTVKDLAEELDLTDNAVRAHLVALERDGLVRQQGERRSGGRPAYLYRVTSEADALFPKAYDLALNHLIHVLRERFGKDELEEILRETGRRAARSLAVQPEGDDPESRVAGVLEMFTRLGGLPKAVRDNGHVRIWNRTGLLSGVASEHPEACLVAEGMLEVVLGESTRASCEVESADGRTRCVYDVPLDGGSSAD